MPASPADNPISSLAIDDLDVVVLMGGTSAEREVSLQSGANVAAALTQSGCHVRCIDPAQTSLEAVSWSARSLAVNMLHGQFGEDGGVQAVLHRLGVNYTGSDAAASYRAFHKQVAKQLFRQSGLPTPDSCCLTNGALTPDAISFANAATEGIVVKPEAQGSSLGVSIVRQAAQLMSAIKLAAQYDEMILLEQAVPGEEWTVPVLGDCPLPPIRISAAQSFFDYSAKYCDATTRYEVFSAMSNPVAQAVAEQAVSACRVLGTRGMCRVDLIVDAEQQPWILEVNTVPGMTAHSLVPKSAAALGWSMNRLCGQLISSALPNLRD